MQTDLEEWTQRLSVIGKVTSRKYVLIVNEDDYWPMTARLIHNTQVRVQPSGFVTKGAAYLVPDPEDK